MRRFAHALRVRKIRARLAPDWSQIRVEPVQSQIRASAEPVQSQFTGPDYGCTGEGSRRRGQEKRVGDERIQEESRKEGSIVGESVGEGSIGVV